jgi:hypothetical protein
MAMGTMYASRTHHLAQISPTSVEILSRLSGPTRLAANW